MQKQKSKSGNKMSEPKIEKVVLNIGGTDEKIEKGVKLLERFTGKKPVRRKSNKRIPTLGISPGMEVGCMVTIRGEKAKEILQRLFDAVDNEIREKKITKNSLSFGIDEYIEIPGFEYQRDIGIIGLSVSVSFSKPGKRVEKRKIKKSKMADKQQVSEKEIIKYLKQNFDVEVIER